MWVSFSRILPSSSFSGLYSARATAVWKAVDVVIVCQHESVPLHIRTPISPNLSSVWWWRRVTRTISDLAAVPFHGSHFLSLGVVFRTDWHPHDISTLLDQLVEEHPPYLLAVGFREVRIVERYVDAGDEGIVEGTDSVCRQEQDALAILHCS